MARKVGKFAEAVVTGYVLGGFAEESLKYFVLRRMLFSSRAVDAASVVMYGLAVGFGCSFLGGLDSIFDPMNRRDRSFTAGSPEVS